MPQFTYFITTLLIIWIKFHSKNDLFHKLVTTNRKKACLLAFSNARSKAFELCKMVGSTLGRPMYVHENEVEETTGGDKDDECDNIEVNKMVKMATVNIKVQVTATFELRSKAKWTEFILI